MTADAGYKTTEIGVIPADWDVKTLGELAVIQRGASPRPIDSPVWFNAESTVGWVRITDVTQSKTATLTSTTEYLSSAGIANSRYLPTGSLIMSICATVGVPVITAIDTCIHDGFVGFSKLNSVTKEYLYIVLKSLEKDFQTKGQMGSQANLNTELVSGTKISVPPIPEQQAIAEALSDVDDLIAAQEALIEKKRAIKQGAMQELLTGRRRLPGFEGEWKEIFLSQCTICLDNLRVPINELARSLLDGIYPYCGANGIVGMVDNFTIDDDVILIAEDGGYFDEYETRPIAYRMSGKIWVNNHAHILKATSGFDQNFIFHALVHKDIRAFITSGTRAKLNKAEMNKITIEFPPSFEEQRAISLLVDDLVKDFGNLEKALQKSYLLKQGMMQELLTGRIRLV